MAEVVGGGSRVAAQRQGTGASARTWLAVWRLARMSGERHLAVSQMCARGRVLPLKPQSRLLLSGVKFQACATGSHQQFRWKHTGLFRTPAGTSAGKRQQPLSPRLSAGLKAGTV